MARWARWRRSSVLLGGVVGTSRSTAQPLNAGENALTARRRIDTAGRRCDPPKCSPASGRRLVQDLPASVLGMQVEERLDGFAIGRTSDLAQEPVGLLQRRQAFTHLVTISLHGVGLRHYLLLLDHALEDEHDLVGRGCARRCCRTNLATFRPPAWPQESPGQSWSE